MKMLKMLKLICLMGILGGILGIIVAAIKIKFELEYLDVGHCYMMKGEDEDTLKDPFVYLVHKRGKADKYLIEQWDSDLGWYGFNTIRVFPANMFMEVECPLFKHTIKDNQI